MRVYKSKIDSGIILLLVASLIGPSMVFILQGEWKGGVILLASMVLVFYLMFQTKYIINGSLLQVKSGFLVNKKIEIKTIVSVKKTDSMLSAPANSITDRIEVIYNEKKSVIISPKEKEAFVAQLLTVNPNIQIAL